MFDVKQPTKVAFRRDVERCADIIWLDLGITPDGMDFVSIFRLCHEKGFGVDGEVLKGNRITGLCVTTPDCTFSMIFVNIGLTDKALATVAFHEFVHAMTHTERYSHLNESGFANYSSAEFLEEVTRAVERRLVDAGRFDT